jgi:hypothetical protein
VPLLHRHCLTVSGIAARRDLGNPRLSSRLRPCRCSARRAESRRGLHLLRRHQTTRVQHIRRCLQLHRGHVRVLATPRGRDLVGASHHAGDPTHHGWRTTSVEAASRQRATTGLRPSDRSLPGGTLGVACLNGYTFKQLHPASAPTVGTTTLEPIRELANTSLVCPIRRDGHLGALRVENGLRIPAQTPMTGA